MPRDLLTARLLGRTCLSESAETFHLEFALEGREQFAFTPGQFISVVAEDEECKEQVRAYSLASAPQGNRFALSLNRVAGGFCSNKLIDLAVGATIQVYGPNGYFTLHDPLADAILVATGTGVAPMRGFLEWVFPADGPDRSGGQEIWLIYGTRYESEIYYRAEFEALAARHANFHYLPTLSREAAGWRGLRGYVQEHVVRIVTERAARLGQPLPAPPVDSGVPPAQLVFDVHAYVCGLSDMIEAVRAELKKLGWHRRQIITERYD